jgi:type I restriction enzyme M protein
MVYGAEKTSDTVKLARMNIAVNGLRGEIKPANSYYEDPYNCYQKFDYVMANPPFNVDDVNLDRVKDQPRFNEYGIPQNKTKKTAKQVKAKDVNTVPNANYLWISLFATSLKANGRAALVMANSASDARNSEADIRRNLVKSGVNDCMLTLPKNMFYTVTLPATLWFFDKRKAGSEPKVLFIDARNIFRQVDKAHREFTEEQIQNIVTIARLHRGETERLTTLLDKYKAQAKEFEHQTAVQLKIVEQVKKDKPEILPDNKANDREIKRWEKLVEEAEKLYKALHGRQLYFEAQVQWLTERFPAGVYEDITGLCKAATLAEIEEQDWSLNPGRYVGVVIEEDGLTEEEFYTEMKKRHSKLKELTVMATDLEKQLDQNSYMIFQL